MTKKRPPSGEQLELVAGTGVPAWRAFVVPKIRKSFTLRELGEARLARLHRAGERTKRLSTFYRGRLYPAFGDLPLTELEPAFFLAWARQLKAEGVLRSSIATYLGYAKGLLEDAVTPPDGSRGVLRSNPARVSLKSLGPVVEPDELENAGDLLLIEDMRRLSTDTRIPFDRRLFWSLLCFTGMRFSEAAGLPWSNYQQPPNTSEHGLWAVVVDVAYDEAEQRVVETTKTKVRKYVPAHPVGLAPIIAQAAVWWRDTFGRAPGPDDFIAPMKRRGRPAHRYENTELERFERDLKLIGRKPRELHWTRHSFISALLAARADMEVVERFTHLRRRKKGEGGSFGGYQWLDWAPRERAILTLDLTPPQRAIEA